MDNELPANELHRWVVTTEACLNKTKPDEDGVIRPSKVKRLNVCVGKESVHRSMLIWDLILKAIEGKFKVRMEKEPPCRTIVTVDGEELSIGLKEKTARKDHIPTPAEEIEMKRYKHLHDVPKWDFLPSGKLVLAIDYVNVHKELVNQVKWTDGEKKTVEDRLGAIVEVLIDVAKDLKEGRERAKEWQRKWDEERRQEKEARRLRVEERKRIKRLKKQVSTWKLAASIRRFINAVREEAARRGGIEPGSPLDKWVQWAEGQAAKIDPVRSLLAGEPGESVANNPASAIS